MFLRLVFIATVTIVGFFMRVRTTPIAVKQTNRDSMTEALCELSSVLTAGEVVTYYQVSETVSKYELRHQKINAKNRYIEVRKCCLQSENLQINECLHKVHITRIDFLCTRRQQFSPQRRKLMKRVIELCCATKGPSRYYCYRKEMVNYVDEEEPLNDIIIYRRLNYTINHQKSTKTRSLDTPVNLYETRPLSTSVSTGLRDTISTHGTKKDNNFTHPGVRIAKDRLLQGGNISKQQSINFQRAFKSTTTQSNISVKDDSSSGESDGNLKDETEQYPTIDFEATDSRNLKTSVRGNNSKQPTGSENRGNSQTNLNDISNSVKDRDSLSTNRIKEVVNKETNTPFRDESIHRLENITSSSTLDVAMQNMNKTTPDEPRLTEFRQVADSVHDRDSSQSHKLQHKIYSDGDNKSTINTQQPTNKIYSDGDNKSTMNTKQPTNNTGEHKFKIVKLKSCKFSLGLIRKKSEVQLHP